MGTVECQNDPNLTPGDCGCDSDGDGTLDCDDECPNEPRKTEAGVCGCTMPDVDYDKKSGPDCLIQGGKAPVTITDWSVAIIVLQFSDTAPEIAALYPSVSELETAFFSPTSLMNNYMRDMSFGKFTGFTGAVFGPFTHPRTLAELVSSGDYAEDEYPQNGLLDTGSAIQIPGFDSADYDAVMVLAYDDYSPNPGGLTGVWTFRINDADVLTEIGVVEALQIGRAQRDSANDFLNPYTELHNGTVFVPVAEDDDGDGERMVMHDGHMMTTFQQTTLHELIHSMGVFSHAKSAMGDGKALTAPGDAGGYEAEEYGDSLAIMGRGEYSVSVSPGYRDLLGWYDETIQLTIDQAGTYSATLYPTTGASGTRSVEIRIPHRVDEFHTEEGYLNDGFMLEVRDPSVGWDSGLMNPQLSELSKGVLVYFNDGFTSWLLDTSPQPYLRYDWGQYPDKRDLALKPSQVFETPDVRIEVLRATGDGGFELAIEVRDNW